MRVLHLFHRDWGYGGSVTFLEALRAYSRHDHRASFAETGEAKPGGYAEMKADFDRALPRALKERSDLLHPHFFYPAARATEAGKPTVFLSHCLVSEEYRLAAHDAQSAEERARAETTHRLCRQDELALYPRINNVLAFTDFHKEEISRAHGRATVVTPPLDLRQVPGDDIQGRCRREYGLTDRFAFAFLARPTFLKGLHLFFAAMELVQEEVQLLLVGDYEQNGDVLEYIPAVGGRERIAIRPPPNVSVRCVGRVDHRQIYRVYQAVDATVCPSLYEALGYVNLESLAAGRPVLAARIGGIPEVVEEGEDGLLFEGGNAAELARGIRLLVGNRGLCQRLGSRGREKVKKFDAQKAVELLDGLYERVAGGGML